MEPKKCPGFTFRKSILVGKTDLVAKEVRVFMEKLAEEYQGNKYHLITRNCNHFCNEVCLKLTQKSIPRWVNRLARLGKLITSEYCYMFASICREKDHQVMQNVMFSSGLCRGSLQLCVTTAFKRGKSEAGRKRRTYGE